MAVRWLTSSGNWSSTSVWNDGATLGIPTTGDDVFTNGFTVNMDVNATVNSLNNSVYPRVAISMTSNSAPSPFSVNSSNGSTDAFRAFDGNQVSSTGWPSSTTTGWLSIDLGAINQRAINGYILYGGGTAASNPNSWQFQGSNDNTNWTTLQTVTSPIGANGSYTSPALNNTTIYRYYRVNVTANGGGASLNIRQLFIFDAITVAGGSFNFNTAGVSVTCTSTSASLSAGATNLITVTATTGTVTLNINSAISGLSTATTQIFNHSGACNFTLSGTRFVGGTGTATYCINKSSTGTITITGSLTGGGSGNQNTNALFSNSGNTIIIGDIFGGTGSNGLVPAVVQSAGNITVTGNVNGGINLSNNGITYTSTGTITINGNVLGGLASTNPSYGVNTTGPLIVNGNVLGSSYSAILSTNTVTVTGNVIAGASTAISSTSANTINVTGDVYASATANGISSTNANGVVNLTGNMYNGLGRNAIYCQNVFVSNTATTLWRMDTGGGDYKFLYSADTTPNLPPITDVRNLVTYGPALSLTGTMVVPAASDVRENVPVDNTVGTGELTSADIISGINASSDSLAVRLKNILTDKAAGNIISQYKDA